MAKRTRRTAANKAVDTTIPVVTATVGTTVQETSVSENTTVETAEVAGRAIVPAETVYNLSTEQIIAAIEAGDIQTGGVVDVTVKAGAVGNVKNEAQPYQQLQAITFAGMVLLSGGKEEPQTPRGDSKVDERTDAQRDKGAPDHFNYGLDLEVKRQLRKQLETEISGPSKIIERTAKLLFEQKMFASMDAARAHVKSMRAEAGLDS